MFRQGFQPEQVFETNYLVDYFRIDNAVIKVIKIEYFNIPWVVL